MRPLPPILNLLANLLLGFLLKLAALCALYLITFFFFLGVYIVVSLTTSLIDLQIVVNRYLEFTIRFHDWEAKIYQIMKSNLWMKNLLIDNFI